MAMSTAKVIGRVCLITAVLLSRVWAREEKDHRLLSAFKRRKNKRKTLPPSWALWCELKRLIFPQMLSSTPQHPRQTFIVKSFCSTMKIVEKFGYNSLKLNYSMLWVRCGFVNVSLVRSLFGQNFPARTWMSTPLTCLGHLGRVCLLHIRFFAMCKKYNTFIEPSFV